MFFASISWAVAIAGPSAVLDSKCSWGRYRKYKDKKKETTESHSGADFALIINNGPGKARLAVFQAKMAEFRLLKGPDGKPDPRGRKDEAINLHHRGTIDGKPAGDSQMVRLARLAARFSHDVDADAAEPPPSVASVQWIHYLVYLTPNFVAIPLGHFEKFYEQARTESNAENFAHLPELRPSLSALMLNAFEKRLPGWLDFDLEADKDKLPKLVDLMPIHYVDSDGSLRPQLEAALPNTLHAVLESRELATLIQSAQALAPQDGKPSPTWRPGY